MTDEEIVKLAVTLEESLATKDDVKRLERKIDEIDQNTKTILKYADAIEETTDDHEKRLKNLEAIPSIAHQINK